MTAPTQPDGLLLRPPEPSDLPILFEQQSDPESNRLAVTFARDADAFKSAWDRNSADPAVVSRVIVVEGLVVGQVSLFKLDGRDSVGYWIARGHWNRGIASRALSLFLQEITIRPLHSRAARSNTASIRVLEKCGFKITGYHQTPATDRHPASERAHFLLA